MSTVYFSLTSHICFLPAIPLSFLISYSYILSLFSYQDPFSFLIFSAFLIYHFSHTLSLLFLYIFVLILLLFPLTSIPFYSVLSLNLILYLLFSIIQFIFLFSLSSLFLFPSLPHHISYTASFLSYLFFILTILYYFSPLLYISRKNRGCCNGICHLNSYFWHRKPDIHMYTVVFRQPRPDRFGLFIFRFITFILMLSYLFVIMC